MTPSDLLISQDEIDKITEALANDAAPAPIVSVIAEQTRKVQDYTLKHALSEERLHRLIRPLALFQLYSLLGQVSPALQADHDSAMKELEEIRDGKFPDLALAVPVPADVASAPARHGSQTRLKMPSE